MTEGLRKQPWYAIAAPIRGVYDSYELCKKDLKGIPGTRRGPVKVSSEAEGWAVLDGGVRLSPGLYAFTDANAIGGLGVVIVRMGGEEGAEPQVLEPRSSSSVMKVLEASPIVGLDNDEAAAALRRRRNILAEMVALYEALNLLVEMESVPSASAITIVHDYFGVSAWMQAGAPPDARISIDPGYYEAAFKGYPWAPAKDSTIAAVVHACWRLASSKQFHLVFRHQPRGRSEAAGEHHFVRYNRMADKLAGGQGSGSPTSSIS